MPGISKRSISSLINKAEPVLLSLAGVVRGLRAGASDPNDGTSLAEFQERLSDAITPLAIAYHDVKHAKRALVCKKKTLTTKWFARRMKCLDDYEKAVLATVEVARCIGDAFAWFFMQNSQQELARHWAHQHTLQLHSGAVARAENQLVKRMKAVNGLLLIYHSLTNILRIGDVTLVDLTTLKVAGAAEIKCRPGVDGQLAADIYFIGPGSMPLSSEDGATPLKVHQIRVATRSHLARQLRQMASVLVQTPPGQERDIPGNWHGVDIEEAVDGARNSSLSVVRADTGLLFLAASMPARCLAARLLYAGRPPSLAAHPAVAEEISGMWDDTQPPGWQNANRMIFGRLRGEYVPGALPLLLTPASYDALLAILFCEVAVFFAYNPAFLVSEMRETGYIIEPVGRHGWKVIGGMEPDRFEFRHLEVALALNTDGLLTQAYIIELFRQILVDSRGNAPTPGLARVIGVMSRMWLERPGWRDELHRQRQARRDALSRRASTADAAKPAAPDSHGS